MLQELNNPEVKYKPSWTACVYDMLHLYGAYLRTSCQSLQYQMIGQYQMDQVSMMTRSQDGWLEYRNIFTAAAAAL